MFWYHCIETEPGVVTPGMGHTNISAARMAMAGVDFNGCRVLDIACWDGILSLMAARRGASQVVGWDRERRENCERWPEVQHVYGDWSDIWNYSSVPFDIVLCTGLLYHTLDPLTWLLRARQRVRNGGILVLETAAYHDTHQASLVWNGGRYYDVADHGNYWFPTLGLLDEWLKFARLVPLRCEWFAQGKICRVAMCCRAVESITTADPWLKRHQDMPADTGAAVTIAEAINWDWCYSVDPPVQVADATPGAGPRNLGPPLDAETQERLAVLRIGDRI